jgi:hypothetical protein
MKRRLLTAWIAATAGCLGGAEDYSHGEISGSLVEFFEDPDSCGCNFDPTPSNGLAIQFYCDTTDEAHRDEGQSLTFYAPLPPAPNFRNVARGDAQYGQYGWESSALGDSYAIAEYSSDVFEHPDRPSIYTYREVYIWELAMPEQLLCAAFGVNQCRTFPAGHASNLRFTCATGLE